MLDMVVIIFGLFYIFSCFVRVSYFHAKLAVSIFPIVFEQDHSGAVCAEQVFVVNNTFPAPGLHFKVVQIFC